MLWMPCDRLLESDSPRMSASLLRGRQSGRPGRQRARIFKPGSDRDAREARDDVSGLGVGVLDLLVHDRAVGLLPEPRNDALAAHAHQRRPAERGERADDDDGAERQARVEQRQAHERRLREGRRRRGGRHSRVLRKAKSTGEKGRATHLRRRRLGKVVHELADAVGQDVSADARDDETLQARAEAASGSHSQRERVDQRTVLTISPRPIVVLFRGRTSVSQLRR